VSTPNPEAAFEAQLDIPDDRLAAQRARLVGFERRFDRISGQMRMLTDIQGVERWATTHHEGGEGLIAALGDRYPLIVFHGDVGTGKTATAEAAADALARLLDTEGFLLKLSTRVRGVGHVGEMSTLINDAFSDAISLAGRKRFVAMVIDEGDALAFNRAAERAHHEDKVGVNTLIQKIDDARRLGGRLLVILCTNRFAALDPAVLRRAALREEFLRPDEAERRELFERTLQGVGLPPDLLDELVVITGPHGGRPAFTYSDIQTRLIPVAIARAYPDRGLTGDDLLVAAAEVDPSPMMEEGEQ
jgi:AAA+ superfamily predicted ATPase